jgi:hypothetical protein
MARTKIAARIRGQRQVVAGRGGVAPPIASRGRGYGKIRIVDLSEIQQAIEQLPKPEQATLTAWLIERDQAEWDAEIEHDFSPGGAGMAVLDEMKRATYRPLEEGLNQKRH